MFSLHFTVCRFQNVWYQTSTKTLPGWCFISYINQNSTWLMFDIIRRPELYLVDVWYQTSTKTLPGWCFISYVNQNSTWLMFDIKHQPKLYLVDVWYQSSTGWLLVDDWYLYTLDIYFLCSLGYVDSKKGIQSWHFLTFLCHFCCYIKFISSNFNQNCIWLMFDINH